MSHLTSQTEYLYGTTQLKDYLYHERQMWPHPSPHSPFMPHTITLIPHEEYQEYMKKIVSRYERTVLLGWLAEGWYAWRNPGLEEINDKEFIRLLTETPFCKSLTPQLDPVDYQTFHEIIQASGERAPFYKYDFSAMKDLEPLEGCYSAGTVTLIRRMETTFEALAISINGLVVTPQDGAAWELSKYFVIMGANIHLLYSEHPLIHFPVDVFNGLTKTLLPTHHVLFQLLYPHCYLQLPLNYGVLYSQRSPAQNKQSEIYNPFHIKNASNLFEFMGRRYSGEQHGNSGYPKYRYMMHNRVEHTAYDRFINHYYEAICEFASQVTAHIQPHDPHVRQWAKYIAQYLPGFPNEAEIFEGDNLARGVAGFMTNSTIIHSLDHYLYSRESVRKIPFRIRVAPPQGKTIPAINRQQLVTRQDIFRHRMAREMFFKIYRLKNLNNIRYGFTDEKLIQLNQAFLVKLQRVEKSVAGANLIPLAEIASSIQY